VVTHAGGWIVQVKQTLDSLRIYFRVPSDEDQIQIRIAISTCARQGNPRGSPSTAPPNTLFKWCAHASEKLKRRRESAMRTPPFETDLKSWRRRVVRRQVCTALSSQSLTHSPFRHLCS
jgi:hypothetical protein